MTESLAAAIWAAGLIAWAVIRWPYQRHARRRKVVRSAYGVEERLLIAGATCGLFIIPLVYLITGVPEFADYRFRSDIGWAGAALMLIVVLVFYLSHKALGRNFSVTLEIGQRQKLVSDGIYRHVRHPMYSGFWLWAAAQALLFPNWVVAGVGILSVAFLYFRRIDREEQMMIETFGDRYLDYCSRTSRLIPWVH